MLSFETKEGKWIFLSACATTLLGVYFVADCLKKSQIKHIRVARKKKTKSPPNTPQEDLPSPHIYMERPYPTSEPIKKPDNIPIYKICLTGGPCAGKTTSLSFISERLTEKGFKVFSVPEIPTLTKQGGGMIIMGGLSPENVMKFQQYLMKMQMKIEDYFTELAILSEQKSVILCDRGVIDPYAYMDEGCWRAILDSQGWNMVNLRDKRYDAVVHLVTAADGAEEFYSLSSNEARYENEETAKLIDKKTQLAWIGHPRLFVIDNSVKGFENKINRVYSAVSGAIGLPLPDTIFRKYLLKSFLIPENLKEEKFNMEVAFLKTEDDKKEMKISKRTQNNLSKYRYSEKLKLADGNSKETQRDLNARNYMILLAQKDENKRVVVKERRCFIWEHQSFILDIVISHPDRLKVLKIDGIEKDFNLKLPPFCEVEKEITGDYEYSNLNFSK